MMHYAYAPLKNFPKSETHVLSAEIRQCMYRLLKLIITVDRKHYKLTTMTDLDVELDFLRELVRFSHEEKILSTHQYKVWAGHLAEIGKMVGGWIKWAKEKAAAEAEKRKAAEAEKRRRG